MYKWQIVWCILSVDYNQYNYCRLRMVCSPILHSVQKRVGLISVSFCLWDCTPLQQSSSLPYGKGLLGEQQSPMQACLSQVHCMCSAPTAETCNDSTEVLLRLKNGTKMYTTEVVWRQQWFWKSKMCGWINRFPEPNGLFPSATLQKKTSVFPKFLNLFTRRHVIIFQISYQCFRLYWLLCI